MLNDFENDLYDTILFEIRNEVRHYAEELDWDDMESSILGVLKQVSNDMDWVYKAYMGMRRYQ